jgi:hypothetical protein
MKTFSCVLLAAFLGSLLVSTQTVLAQGTTAFTYQGQLNDGGTNANGVYTMIFALYNAASGGNQIGSTITNNATLANGLFTVNLDFGTGAFTGNACWLGITITSGGTTQELSPRVQVLPVPYALYAANANTAASASNVASAISVTNAVILNALVTNSIITNSTFAGNGTGLTNITATSLSNGTWNVTVGNYVGNYQNTPNIFGFYDNNSLVLALTDNEAFVSGELEVNSNLTVNRGGLSVGNINLTGGNGNPGGITFSNNCASPSISAGCDGNSNGEIIINGDLNVSGCINGQFCQSSDKNLKEKFTPIDGQGILERVANLPISSWSYKQDSETRHIGPMAQDFYSAFNVGPDDKHITTVDEGGVALAAIQGLNEKLKEKDAQIEALEKRLSDLEQLVKGSAQK